MRLFLCFLFTPCLLWSAPLLPSVIHYEDYIYDPVVRSVQFYVGEQPLTYPVFELNGTAQLTLAFDLLGEGIPDLSYSVVYCEADWQPSPLQPIEYYDGFTENHISDARGSQQALVHYAHYTCRIPADGQNFKLSGNYLVKVYRGTDPDSLLLTRRFLVTETAMQLTPDVGFSQHAEARTRLQQVSFNLNPADIKLIDPLQEIKVAVLQNFRWDNARTGIQPQFIYPDHLAYSFNSATDFAGGNEFRMFDIRSLKRQGIHIDHTTCSPNCTVVLQADMPRTRNEYLSSSDLNGNYIIGVLDQVGADPNTDGDYVRVHFRLQATATENEDKVYIFGQLTGWRIDPRFILHPDGQSLIADVALKQGLYNYQYVVMHAGSSIPDETALEGSHVETENYYTILVYYRPIGGRADRLAAIRFVNYFP